MPLSHLLPLISTSCIVVSAVLIAIGWRLILRKKRAQHKRTMLWGASFALLFFIIYCTKSAIFGDTTFGGPDSLKATYVVFLLFHIVLATSAAVFGIVTLVFAFTRRFSRHRKLGRITASIWFVTAVTGIVVYTLLYVLYPGGETAGLIDAVRNK